LTRRVFTLICALYVTLAVVYSVVTPVFEASDELWHYPMVHVLANNGLRLPVQDAAVPTPWRQEGSQPPLYYLIAAVLTAPIDTGDLDYVRRINPHADIGLVLPDSNINMIVHRFDAEAFPWRGAVLAVHVARFFSVLLGLGTVIVTYSLAYQLFPDKPAVRLLAASLNAFLPMFLFIAGSVNNDNLSTLLGNLLTLLIVLLLKRERAPHWRDYALIGTAAGMGLLSKLSLGFMIPLIAFALLIAALHHRDPRPVFVGGLISGGLTTAIAGWWYLRNLQLYGDPTGLNVFLDIVGRRAIPANAAQLWAERESFARAFWGFFGGMNLPMPDPIYLVLNTIAVFSLISALLFLLQTALRHRWTPARWLPTLITLIWIGVSFASYLRWTAETPASQGRLIFGALSSICVWMAVGWLWWQPIFLRRLTAPAFGGGMALLAALVPFAVIAPAYAPPPLTQASASMTPDFADQDGGALALIGSDILTERVYAGEFVHIRLSWGIVERFNRDWSLFVHLVSPDDVIAAQRDIYPGAGRLALSDLDVNTIWTDQIAVFIPRNAYAPQRLSVEVGWYHLPTGSRMISSGGDPSARRIIGALDLEPPLSDLGVPNPISVNFGGLIELVGYGMSDLSPAAGSAVEVTLYWRALQPIAADYVVFVHIIDPPTLTIYAGSDAQPAAWTRPTSTWRVGEIIEDRHMLIIRPDAPPAIYEVEIGLYLQNQDGGFDRLRVVTPDGGMANDYAYLNRVRILPREEAP
jgi:4-amino-4-deoxy-L-arabinose transferase-like glycosyltransferase